MAMTGGNSDSNMMPPEDLRPTRESHLAKGPFAVAKVLIQLFSGRTSSKRDPPSATKTLHGLLITISLSHYCEKARWGLDLVEADPENPFYYTESTHPPAFASFVSVPASSDQSSAVPMLVFDSQGKDKVKNMYNSNVILQQMCPFLYPEEIKKQVIELEAELGRNLGAGVRCFAYHYLIDPPYYSVLSKACTAHCSKVETVLFGKMVDKGIDKGMRKLMKINESSAIASAEAIRKVFDDMSKRLRDNDGKGYLMDTTTKSYGFTAVDLTLAALAAPIIAPPELSGFSAPEKDLPPEIVRFKKELLGTAAGQHVLKIYRDHRFGANNRAVLATQQTGSNRVVVPKIGRIGYPWAVIMAGVGGGAIASLLIARHFSKKE